MKFNETKFFQGGKVRRKSWKDYVVVSEKSNCYLAFNDLTADDWEDDWEDDAEKKHEVLCRYTMRTPLGQYYQTAWISAGLMENYVGVDDVRVRTETKAVEILV